METREVHVVFGAGQVGSHLSESLLRSGAKVRVAKRSPAGTPEGAERALGDATDPAFCRRAVAGAQVVYHCMNPAYSARVWEDVLPKVLENLIAAMGAAGARLVVLDNLYMVGTGDGGPINEDTPVNPRSRKGEIRARLAERLFAAHERGDVRAVAGRASDFYGPRGEATHFGERFWRPALAGKPAEFFPDPVNRHTYHFIPDVAEGLVRLGSGPDTVLGRPWMLPCAPAETSRALVDRFGIVLGRDIALRGMPKFARKALGLVIPIVREVDEMLHQWESPFIVDDARFRAEFGATATDPAEGAALTVEWARAQFGKAS